MMKDVKNDMYYEENILTKPNTYIYKDRNYDYSDLVWQTPELFKSNTTHSTVTTVIRNNKTYYTYSLHSKLIFKKNPKDSTKCHMEITPLLPYVRNTDLVFVKDVSYKQYKLLQYQRHADYIKPISKLVPLLPSSNLNNNKSTLYTIPVSILDCRWNWFFIYTTLSVTWP